MIRIFRFLAICTIGAALAASPTAWAQTYTPVDYPGAAATIIDGGPNPQGASVGTYIDASGAAHGFLLDKRGAFTPFDPPGSTATTPNYITPQGTIVGGYVDASGTSHGFILSGRNYTTVDYPGAAGTQLTGMNPSGALSGFSCDVASCATPPFHGFTRSKKGVFTIVNPPGAVSTEPATVSPSGVVVGGYTDGAGVGHGFVLFKGTYVTNDFPGSIFTFDGGGNAEGDIAGIYVDSGGVGHGFLLSNGVYTSFDYPGASLTEATGINPAGVIVGLYQDAAGVDHGFIRTP